MRAVQTGPVIGLIGQLAVLSVLAGTVGLGAVGWLVGTALRSRHGRRACRTASPAPAAVALGAANRVTLTRATLVGGVTALVADALVGPAHVAAMVGLAVVALVLDGVDGWVARRTGTVSALGARFDMEVDAFLILVLSVYVAGSVGRGCSPSARPGTPPGRPAGWCGGCAGRCRRGTGASPWPRSRASCSRPPWPTCPGRRASTWRSPWRWSCSPSPSAGMWCGSGASTGFRGSGAELRPAAVSASAV